VLDGLKPPVRSFQVSRAMEKLRGQFRMAFDGQGCVVPQQAEQAVG
jgi:hypothetical protein